MNHSLRPKLQADVRYTLRLRVRYFAWKSTRRAMAGSGQLIDMSSSELIFGSDTRMAPGDSVAAAIDWPLSSRMGDPMTLLIGGHVVRGEAGSTAMGVEKHHIIALSQLDEYRTGPADILGSHPICPVVLVNEHRPWGTVSWASRDTRYAVYRAGPNVIKRVLHSGFPPVRLVMSDTLEPFAGIPISVPVIYTAEHRHVQPETLSR
jgi:hypothetical protein